MNRYTSAASLLVLFLLSGIANAALIIDFKPEPTNELPELVYSGAGPAVPSLRAGPGATANGDSGLPPEQQTPGGLTVEVPFPIPGIPGGTINTAAGTTTVRDVTLRLTGLGQSGSHTIAGNVTTQGLSAGTFQFIAGDGLGAPSVILLEGTIGDATMVLHAGATGSVLSSTVTYTGGLLPEITDFTGSLSFSLINITPIGILGPEFIVDFTADATGQFTLIPEPAALGLLTTIAALLAARRRRSA